LKHFGGVVIKSEACFLSNPIAELAWHSGTLLHNGAMVAIATTLVVLDLHQTFQAKLVGNNFLIFSAKKFSTAGLYCQSNTKKFDSNW